MKSLTQKLFDIQQRVKPLVKDSSNPFFKSKYADLNQCLELIKGECKLERLLLAQGPDVKEGIKGVRTSVIDVDSDKSIDCFVPYSGNEKNAQEIGAATTYNRRFGLVSLFALEQDDDDGETAVGRGPSGSNTTKQASDKVGASAPKTTTPVQAQVSKIFNREACLKKISLSSKVIIDSKRSTLEDVVKMLTAFGVKSKEELNDEQAKKLLSQLEEKLNAK